MPLRYGLTAVRKHFVPVFHLHDAALSPEHDLPDGLVAPHAVVVHDGDYEARMPDPLVGYGERERLVVDRVEVLLFHFRLLLLHFLAVVHQPDFDVGVCAKQMKNGCNE